MNRFQYWALIAGSSLVVLLLVLQVVFARQAQYAQARLLGAQQVITQGNNCHVRLQQLANRIYQLSVQTQDQGLRDLLVRQQIPFPSSPANNAPAQPTNVPAPLTR
jgi:hypothetical protein